MENFQFWAFHSRQYSFETALSHVWVNNGLESKRERKKGREWDIEREKKMSCRRHLKLHVIVTFYALFAFIYTTIVYSWLCSVYSSCSTRRLEFVLLDFFLLMFFALVFMVFILFLCLCVFSYVRWVHSCIMFFLWLFHVKKKKKKKKECILTHNDTEGSTRIQNGPSWWRRWWRWCCCILKNQQKIQKL